MLPGAPAVHPQDPASRTGAGLLRPANSTSSTKRCEGQTTELIQLGQTWAGHDVPEADLDFLDVGIDSGRQHGGVAGRLRQGTAWGSASTGVGMHDSLQHEQQLRLGSHVKMPTA
jgi:hypothetical protein